MICSFCFLVVLLHQTVLADVCHRNISQPSQVVVSSEDYEYNDTFGRCIFLVAAPENSSILLNFTQLHGFTQWDYAGSSTSIPSRSIPGEESFDQKQPPANCLPKVEIQELRDSADDNMQPIALICHPSSDYAFPLQSNHVKIIYHWQRHHISGFTLALNFKKPMSTCEFHCQDGSCLPQSLVCNGQANCKDESDEVDCTKHTNDATILVIVIVITVIGLALVGLCAYVLCLHRLVRQMQNRHSPSGGANTETHHLHPHTPTEQSPEVVYVQQQHQGALEVERERDHQRIVLSVKSDDILGLPVSVCRSKDGEEGYAKSQQQLQIRNHRESVRNCIVPPPNVTLSQSQPPNRSYSVEVLDRHSSKAANRTAPSMSPTQIPRCHTMSAATDNNNRLNNLNFNFPQTVSGGGVNGRGGGGSHGPPHLGSCHGNNNPASLSLGVGGGATGGNVRRTVRLASSPAAIGRSRHRSSTSSNQSNTSNLSLGSGSPAFDPPAEYCEVLDSSDV